MDRRNTQQIVDFLREKNFASSIRPTVYTRQVCLWGKTIDVIVIKNDRNTPYYLKSKYQDVRANHVYTRVMDINTPKDKSADRTHIESLWKKSFHLDAGPLERVTHYLTFPDAWDHSPIETHSIQYYRYYPEYTIEKIEDLHRNGYEYYLFNQSDSRPRQYVGARKERFEQIADKINKENHLPHFPELKGYIMEAFIEEYVNMQALIWMFAEFQDS